MIVNPLAYYGNRQISFVPPHFIKSNTPISRESMFWVKTKLTGRFAVHSLSTDNESILFDLRTYVFFEDPKEAVLYELRWSGSK
jgi:hypothetical protein